MNALKEHQFELIDWENAESNLQKTLDSKDNSKINEDKYQGIQAGIPIILMGKIGCGKSSLINYLRKPADINDQFFHQIDVHGHFLENDINKHMIRCIEQTQKYS